MPGRSQACLSDVDVSEYAGLRLGEDQVVKALVVCRASAAGVDDGGHAGVNACDIGVNRYRAL